MLHLIFNAFLDLDVNKLMLEIGDQRSDWIAKSFGSVNSSSLAIFLEGKSMMWWFPFENN